MLSDPQTVVRGRWPRAVLSRTRQGPCRSPPPRAVPAARATRGRRGLLPPDVLLAGLQGEDIAAVPRGVSGLADDPPGHPPVELGARSQEAVVRAAVGDG